MKLRFIYSITEEIRKVAVCMAIGGVLGSYCTYKGLHNHLEKQYQAQAEERFRMSIERLIGDIHERKTIYQNNR